MKNIFVLVFSLFCLGFSSTVSAQLNYPSLPTSGWIVSQSPVYVKPSFERYYPTLAILRFGDRVKVIAIQGNRAQLEPFGVMNLSDISFGPMTNEARATSAPIDNFVFARVLRNTEARESTDSHSNSVEHLRRGYELMFVKNPELQSRGFLQRAMSGGYVRISDLRLFEPSTFSGWHNPPDDFVFVNKDTVEVLNNGSIRNVSRYERFPLLAISRGFVTTTEGVLRRQDVRIGQIHQHPNEVPRNVRWVLVNLSEQTLEAYDRNDDMVFVTLISSGRRAGSTHTGIFSVRRITTWLTMRSSTYVVDTTNVLYFDDQIAIHSAYWNNNLGNVYSHGCLNTSLLDSKYIFEFSEIQIPQGWSSISPSAFSSIETMWVIVQ